MSCKLIFDFSNEPEFCQGMYGWQLMYGTTKSHHAVSGKKMEYFFENNRTILLDFIFLE